MFFPTLIWLTNSQQNRLHNYKNKTALRTSTPVAVFTMEVSCYYDEILRRFYCFLFLAGMGVGRRIFASPGAAFRV